MAPKRSHSSAPMRLMLLLAILAIAATMPAIAQQVRHDMPESLFPAEAYENYTPPLPNDKIDFHDDCSRSCCAGKHSDKDPSHYMKPNYQRDVGVSGYYLDRRDPAQVTPCEQLAAMLPLREDRLASGGDIPSPRVDVRSNSTNRVTFPFARIENREGNNERFHVLAAGGMSRAQLDNVRHYSVCAGRGDNVVAVHHTDNGGIHTHGGNNRIILAGNTTNQFTRAGHGGNNVIEIAHAAPVVRTDKPKFRNEQWDGNSIFRTSLSGGNGDDTVVLKDLPTGSKWCHIGDYTLFGEQFHVVEFALPPSVVQGPRRQRINFGTSIDYVTVFNEKMTLREFMENKPSNSKLCQPEEPVLMMMQPPPSPPKPAPKVIRGYW